MGSILVTDDDRGCCDIIQRTLEREGYIVEGAADVDAALNALRCRTFDLIVCDYRMPGKTGLDLLSVLHEQGSRVPVLIVSAFADDGVEAAALELGASGLLRKPFRRRDLIDFVARAIH
jgi:DNA-binding response OmpR family regulator